MTNKVLLLSIDGGGVRGKIAATFLAALEKDLNKSLYATFDFFAGTSTGALIVLSITANQYTAKKINDLYTHQTLKEIFKKSFWRSLPISFVAKYNQQGKRNLLNKLFGKKRFLAIEKPTLITAYDVTNNKAVIFKSSGGSDSADDLFIAEIADATTAGPTYFPSVVTTGRQPRNLIDGGIAANDPSICLICEALKHGHSLDSIYLLSLGTGYSALKTEPAATADWGVIGWLDHGLIDDFMLGDSSMAQYQCQMLLGKNYLRIDGLLENTNLVLDNLSPANLIKLEALGYQWYLKSKESLLAFLSCS